MNPVITNAFDLSDETATVCRVWRTDPDMQMHTVAFRNAVSQRLGSDATVDLRQLVIELDGAIDRCTNPELMNQLIVAVRECRLMLLRITAERDLQAALERAHDNGVQQWQIKAMLTKIYGDKF